jgi:hypothetical protein
MKWPYIFFVTLATLRLMHLGHYFLEPADTEDICVSSLLQGQLNA